MAQSVAFDRAVEYYDATRGFPLGEEKYIAETIQRVGNFPTSTRILEIGVGTGRIALPLSPHVQAYFGLDISRPMMDKLRGKQRGEPIYLTEGDATRLPYPDQTFDGAVVVHVFHLIPGWKDALNELGRVLKPTAPMVHCWTQDTDEFRAIWDEWNKTIPMKNRSVGVRWENNPNFLEDAGWKPVAEPQTYTYTVHKTARNFLERVKQRCWSAMWSVSDEEMERGLAVIEPLIEAAHPDKDATIQSNSTFYARAYLPPSR